MAIAFRVFFLVTFRLVDGDSLVYGDMAKNWLLHGIFGVSTTAGPVPTYIRLPAYPALLAAIWSITGVEHYTAVLIVQLLMDVGTCFVVADLTRRLLVPSGDGPSADKSDRAAQIAFALAALCPFLATYVAAPLTETPAILLAAIALDAAVAALDDLSTGRLLAWTICGLAIAGSILLRPDGGILLAALGLYLGYQLLRGPHSGAAISASLFRKRVVIGGTLVAVIALAPLIPWTIRNWRDFHRFQPLAPRYANAPDEPVNYGFQRWTKTWMLDFVSVSEIYWNVPGEPFDVSLLPNRAFDNAEERAQTEKLLSEYNAENDWTPQIDRAIGQIAAERIRRAPLRYYLWLPLGRIADMWMRPRTAMLQIDDRWWEFRDDPAGTFWGSLLGIINLVLVTAAALALWRHRRLRFVGMLIVFVLLRSAFLGSLENPEPRYTLECFPVVLALAGVVVAGKGNSYRAQDTIDRGAKDCAAVS